MIRGTTPTHTFEVPQIDTSHIRELRITYVQFNNTVLEKDESEVTMSEHLIELTLTQEETLRFNDKLSVSIQLKVLMDDGSVLASRIMQMSVEKILCEEVLLM